MTLRLVLLLSSLFLLSGNPAGAQPDTRFLYQGVLQDGAGAAEADYDFRIGLFDGPGPGAVEVAPELGFFDVTVVGGAFVLELDFGTAIFGGDERWLEISVREAGDPAYTTLSPRQRVSSVPVAMVADLVHWDSLGGMPAGFADGEDADMLGKMICSNGDMAMYSPTSGWHCEEMKAYQGEPPVFVDPVSATIGLNAATDPGDLLTWNGDHWIAAPPTADNPVTLPNMQPFLALNYVIALQGIYPSRNGAEPFVAEIMPFGGNFAPRGWATCNGQLLPVSTYSALFSLIGTYYGGDGRSTFALPDLRGRTPMHFGNGPGLTNRRLGEKGGSETVTHDHR